ncbi:MAG TPA: APC family permease [Candidatus Limnocylindrales bacterium]|nr:APC family permease [Candidatus Limnocylindrales bacterium]
MSATPRSPVATALAADRLGAASVASFALTAAAPLMVVGGLLVAGWANIGVVGFPLALLIIGAVLALFCFGYIAMAQRIPNAGAFSAYVAQGLGRPGGVAASLVALLSYNALQFGLFGIFGAALSGFLDSEGIAVIPWWVLALVAWVVTTTFGVLRVDLNSKVLLTLLALELVVVIVYDAAFLATPAEGLSFAAFSPDSLFGDLSLSASVLVIVVTAFIGFEAAPVFAEESRDARRTVGAATFTGLAVMLVAYVLTTWAITVTVGPSNVVDAATSDSQNLMFSLASDRLAPWIGTAGSILLITSAFAAMLSFHNTCARYSFALAREGVLPRALAFTGTRSGAPQASSLLQSGLSLIVVIVYAILDLDPVNQLFYWGGALGGFGIVALLIATSISVVVYFGRRGGDGESVWKWLLAPIVSAIALAMVLVFVWRDFHNLIAVPPEDPLRWIFPMAFVAVAVLGILWALVLKATKPEVYRRIGLGAEAGPAMGPGVDFPAPGPASGPVRQIETGARRDH